MVMVEYKICLLKHKTTHHKTLWHKRYCYIELANKFIWVFCNIFMKKLNCTQAMKKWYWALIGVFSDLELRTFLEIHSAKVKKS